MSCHVDLSPSDTYDAEPRETKVCLELGCSTCGLLLHGLPVLLGVLGQV